MRVTVGWRRRLGAAGLALLVGLVSVATCYAGTREMSQREEVSCCHGMPGGCGDSEMPSAPADRFASPHHDCCAVPAASLTFTTALDRALAPSTDWVALEAPVAALADESDFTRSASAHSSPPPYLLFSTFRI